MVPRDSNLNLFSRLIAPEPHLWEKRLGGLKSGVKYFVKSSAMSNRFPKCNKTLLGYRGEMMGVVKGSQNASNR